MKTYSIVGQKHCGQSQYNEGVLPGTLVVLVREPDNRVDPFAVQVWLDGKRIGYLAAKGGVNIEIAKYIDRVGGDGLALDSKLPSNKSIEAVFRRSPHTSYPQVEVDIP